MKNKSIFIISALLVAIIVAAVLLYPKLSTDYQQNQGGEQETVENSSVTKETELNEKKLSPAVDFSVIDMNGNQVNLSDFFGKPIVVNFWTTWCSSCRTEMPAFEELYQIYGDDVVFLMVNLTDGVQDTQGSVKRFVDEAGYTFPVYCDITYSAAKAYGIYSIPETLFINADGEIADRYIGAMNESTLKSYINLIEGDTK